MNERLKRLKEFYLNVEIETKSFNGNFIAIDKDGDIRLHESEPYNLDQLDYWVSHDSSWIIGISQNTQNWSESLISVTEFENLIQDSVVKFPLQLKTLYRTSSRPEMFARSLGLHESEFNKLLNGKIPEPSTLRMLARITGTKKEHLELSLFRDSFSEYIKERPDLGIPEGTRITQELFDSIRKDFWGNYDGFPKFPEIN